MGDFLRENWIWIAAPFVLVGLIWLAAWLFGSGGMAPMDYTLF